MGLYKDSRLTTQGKELITRALMGNTKIIFTNIAFGDGSHAESDDITTLTKLKNQKQLFPISGKETINEKTVHLKFVASNINTNGDSLKEGYFIRELGIYAKPDVEGAEEILYSVAVEISGKGDYMPPYNDLAPSTITMDWYTEVSDAENVLIQASDSAYALAEEFNKLDEEFHNPTFEDSGTASGISNFQSFLNSMKSKMNIFEFFRNLKAGLKYVLHVGSLVNNCVSDNPNLPLAASQGKVLQDQINVLNANNAGAHNAIYRGKALGSTVTDTQYAAIKAGTFENLYIGDYWTIDGVNYRIAAFDYYLNSGDIRCISHHVVIVPDTCLYDAKMNTSNITTGGYVGSEMYTANLTNAKITIKNAFSGHLLKHRIYLTNAVANGRASGGAWCDSEVDLMCEQMVYGNGIFSPVSDGSNVPANYRVEKSQLPLFQHEPSRICNREAWWLRDVITASDFARVYAYGDAAYYYVAPYALGVRPAFCIS